MVFIRCKRSSSTATSKLHSRDVFEELYSMGCRHPLSVAARIVRDMQEACTATQADTGVAQRADAMLAAFDSAPELQPSFR